MEGNSRYVLLTPPPQKKKVGGGEWGGKTHQERPYLETGIQEAGGGSPALGKEPAFPDRIPTQALPRSDPREAGLGARVGRENPRATEALESETFHIWQVPRPYLRGGPSMETAVYKKHLTQG